MLISHKGEYCVRGKEGPSFWIPAYAISTVLPVYFKCRTVLGRSERITKGVQ